MNRYDKLSRLLNVNELLLIEDALKLFMQACSPERKQDAEELHTLVVMAGRWRKQLGKADRDV